MTQPLVKPLGRKAYGHVPHLPGSRLGPGDHKIGEGQARICLERARDRHDIVSVREKLDGSNCCVANVGGEIIPLGRSGYRADTSPYRQHHLFAAWVYERQDRFLAALEPGERLVGEWLAQAHGTRYDLRGREPFVAFDLMVAEARLPEERLEERAAAAGVPTAPLLHRGAPLGIEAALELLGTYGHYGAIDPAEGAVWRVERRGAFDFMAKFVHPWKVDGLYLPEQGGQAEVWNWLPEGEREAEA